MRMLYGREKTCKKEESATATQAKSIVLALTHWKGS
jgi:hypothetical protein